MLKRMVVLILAALLLFSASVPVLAEEPADTDGTQSQGLTIEQAISQALVHSKSLQQAGYDVERIESVRDGLAQTVDYSPHGLSSPYIVQVFTALSSADLAYRMSQRTETMEEDKVMLSAYKAYTDVIKYGQNLEYAQKSFNQAAWQKNVADLSYQQGMISQYEKIAADVQYQVAQNTLVSAEKDLNSAYLTFNQLLGLGFDERPILAEKPAYSAIEEVNMQEKVARILNSSPAVWLADHYIAIAEQQLDLFDPSTTTDTWTAKEIDIDKAKLDAQDAREQTAQFVRSVYNSLLKMEESYGSVQQAVNLAQEDLRIKRLKMDIGMATRTDVQAAELALQDKQKTLDNLVFQHEAWKVVFDKPWTYTVLLSTSSSTAE